MVFHKSETLNLAIYICHTMKNLCLDANGEKNKAVTLTLKAKFGYLSSEQLGNSNIIRADFRLLRVLEKKILFIELL